MINHMFALCIIVMQFIVVLCMLDHVLHVSCRIYLIIHAKHITNKCVYVYISIYIRIYIYIYIYIYID